MPAEGQDEGQQPLEYMLEGETGFPYGRPIDKLGSAHSKAIVLTILGPAPPARGNPSRGFCPLDLEVSIEPPDLESEPVAVREVIPREEFPRVNREGGAVAYLLRHYEMGKYRLLWVGASMQTVADQTFVVPEPREERWQREVKLEELRLDKERRGREQARIDADAEALVDGWVKHWLCTLALWCRHHHAVGSKGAEALQAAERFLRTNASHFVRVRHGCWRWGLRRDVAGRRVPVRWWDRTLRLESRLPDHGVLNAILAFVPTPERRES